MLASLLPCLISTGALAANDSIDVELKNAHRTVTYHAAKLVDGETVTLKNETLTASEGNEIVALVVNGGKLVLDHCTIVKTGDGISTSSGRQGGGPGMRGGGPGPRPEGGNPPEGGGMRPREPQGGAPMMLMDDPEPQGDSIKLIGGYRPNIHNLGGPRFENGEQEPQGDSITLVGGYRPLPPSMRDPGYDEEGGPQGDSISLIGGNRPMPRRMGGGPGGGGDDSFNFYGTNSAVVALGEGSRIEMIACKVTTDAEYANAVFSADDAEIVITEGIDIDTSKGSSRGLFATCAGKITATGPVVINTKGPHCAPLATDRGGGTVIVGEKGTTDVSVLNAAGEGSPCIYSTGDIIAYNATGKAEVSQTMVIEGKNTITIDHCNFTGNSPKHGGIMLYQSMSGDATIGESRLEMTDCTIRDLSHTAMFLVTNTQTVVVCDNCTFLDPQGNPIGEDYPLITCRNCNTDGHNWGREGSNGGQIKFFLEHQDLSGTLLANEADSSIEFTVNCPVPAGIHVAEGAGKVDVKTASN